MKTILNTIIMACLGLIIFNAEIKAQNAPITFEPAGFGNAWVWNTFENGPNTPVAMVANPSTTGINTSSTVARITAMQIGMPWAGFENIHPGSAAPGASPLGTFTLNATNSTVKIMVYKSVISDVGIKFATASNASTGEIKVANTLINQWEELTFNFAGKIGEPSSTGIDQIIIFPDFQVTPVRGSDNICYVDNITFAPSTAAPTGPTVAAPTPTRPAANVISIFSNAYTNVPVNTFATSWSVGAVSDVLVAGNDNKRYSGLDYAAIEFVGPNLIDASSMAVFHLDAWTPNMTSFRIKLVDFGANAIFGGGDDKEHELIFTPTLSGWNSYELALSDFTGLTTKAHLAQIIIAGAPVGSGIVFVDNIYFHNISNVPLVAAPTPTSPPSSVISMFSNAYTNVPVNTWATGWSAATLTNVLIAGNATKRYTLLDFVGVETVGPNLINATNMTSFNVALWTPNMTTFRIKLVDWGANGIYQGGDDVEHELTFTPVLSGWNNYHIPLSAFTGLVTKAHIAQLIFSGTPTGLGTAYIDNVYFSNSAIALPLTLTSFTASMLGSDAVINWKTNNETNVKEFKVEKSLDGISFNQFATIAANNSRGENFYSIKDFDIQNTSYYRLKMMDIDGQFTYSQIAKLSLEAFDQVSVFPNPASNSIVITNNQSSLLNSEATIYDAFGKKMMSIKLKSSSEKIEIRSLSKGNYLIQFINGTSLKFTKE